ncbi:flagellar biosynthesis repressor FlbT [Bradyrhizobium algeriense]|uniref:flagellar biosynthesis repressor FlbT n=1 Tax=Bradyrhizobium algeriense TaxID=634784 RepID=UPI000D3A4C3B|nr:flagellar biosynthesis repressor FlbT [Bradyrhizobium algeriense]
MVRKRREPLRSPASSNGDCADARITIDTANAHVAAGALYKALKEIRKLVKREDELLAA